jgi:hypothetical protein
MKRTIFTLLAAVAVLLSVNGADKLTIKKAGTAPKIDGKATDAVWAGADEVPVTLLKGDNAIDGIKFKMVYDATNIYVLVTVPDATPNMTDPAGVTWQSDCVEIFFGMDTISTAAYGAGDWQIRKLDSKSQADGGVDGSGNIAELTGDANFIVEQVDGSPMVQEWQLPIATLNETATPTPKAFRFDMQVANNIDGATLRTGQSFWNSSADNQYAQNTNMGYVLESDAVIGTAVKSVVAASSIRIKTNSIELTKTSNVSIFDVTGKLVLKASNVNSINTSSLKNGVYFVNANNETKKFLK